MPKVSLTRRYEFRASHKLDSSFSAEKENVIHGHNYYVEISFLNNIHSETGLIIDRDKLDAWVKENIIKKYDKKLLNNHIQITTGENLVQNIFQTLKQSPFGDFLQKIRIQETDKNAFIIQ